jgi:hypothetical protein
MERNCGRPQCKRSYCSRNVVGTGPYRVPSDEGPISIQVAQAEMRASEDAEFASLLLSDSQSNTTLSLHSRFDARSACATDLPAGPLSRCWGVDSIACCGEPERRSRASTCRAGGRGQRRRDGGAPKRRLPAGGLGRGSRVARSAMKFKFGSLFASCSRLKWFTSFVI